MTAREAAAAFDVPERTARRWLATWLSQKVPGIALVPARGRYGAAFRVQPDVVARWKRGALPVPHESLAQQAA